MPLLQGQPNPAIVLVKRAFSWWPYIFIAISVIGLADMLWNANR